MKSAVNLPSMLLVQYRGVFKKCFPKNAAVPASGLSCCAAPAAATDYTAGWSNPNNYSTSEELCQRAADSFADGDIVSIYNVASFLIGDFDFSGTKVTIKLNSPGNRSPTTPF